MKANKICIIATIPGTIKTFVLDTAKYLYKEAGYDITIVCNYDETLAELIPWYIKYKPVKMKRGVSLHGFGAIFSLLRLFKKEKFDLVQYSTPNASFYAAIAAKVANIPIRLYCQWGILYVGFSGFKHKILKLLEKTTCACSTFIEPDSFGNLEFSRKEGLYPASKSAVVGFGSSKGVDLKRFEIAQKKQWKDEIDQKYHLSEDLFRIGFVGRITRDKGINELFGAMQQFLQRHPKSVLLMIGPREVNGTVNQELFAWSQRESRILYCGNTTEVQKYYASMDVLVLPSYREGLPNVVLEAQAMGVPVVVSDIPGAVNAMENGKTGIVVKKGSVKSLYHALDNLKADKSLLEQMGKKGRLYIEDQFDQEVVFKNILKDRNRLLGNKEGE